jgi:hypothetical protein
MRLAWPLGAFTLGPNPQRLDAWALGAPLIELEHSMTIFVRESADG